MNDGWFGSDHEGKEIIHQLVKENSRLTGIIEKQADIIATLVQTPPVKTAKALRAKYTVDKSGNIVFNHTNNTKIMAQDLVVLFGQNSVPGQLIPVAADLVTDEPINTIQAGSEAYTVTDEATGLTSTVATVAAVAGGAEGQFSIDRIPGQQGVVLVMFTALAADGVTQITNIGGAPDRFTFQGQPTGVAAALRASYGPAAKKK